MPFLGLDFAFRKAEGALKPQLKGIPLRGAWLALAGRRAWPA